MRKFSFLILILILTSVTFAQTTSENSTIVAVVDANVFNDREKGINRLVQAENSYNIENYEARSLSKKISALEKEIDLLLNQKSPINEKYLELQKLKGELLIAEDATRVEYKRKYSIIVEPVIEKIRIKLQEFNKIYGYALIIDKTFDSILVEGKVDDITEKFIQFCNESFEKELK